MNYKDWFSLTTGRFVEAGLLILSLESLKEMTKAEAKATVSPMPGWKMGAEIHLDICMCLNADHKVVQALGLDIGDLTPTIFKNVRKFG